MIQTLKSTRAHGGVVNTLVTIAVAKAFVSGIRAWYVQFRTDAWARSLFNRMRFITRIVRIGKVEIPEKARKEAELTPLHEILKNLRNSNFHHH